MTSDADAVVLGWWEKCAGGVLAHMRYTGSAQLLPILQHEVHWNETMCPADQA